MRHIFLIRHAMPDIPLGERWCVGRTDFPLGTVGHLQAALLPFTPELNAVKQVFCSKLSRSMDTARPLSASPTVISGLEEQDMGLWDGLSFQEIRSRWPALYAAREANPNLLPDGAEAFAHVQERFRAALQVCLENSTGDIAVVSHKSCMASLIGQRDKLDYTSYVVLEASGTQLRQVSAVTRPHPVLSDTLCLSLLEAAGAEQHLIKHCIAVANKTAELCDVLKNHGTVLDAQRIRTAALLHDLARSCGKEHPAVGAAWLKSLGYSELAELVRQHHDPDSADLNEAAVLFLADKLVQGDRPVSLATRFENSRAKCSTPEALAAHNRRYALACTLQDQINRTCQAQILS